MGNSNEILSEYGEKKVGGNEGSIDLKRKDRKSEVGF